MWYRLLRYSAASLLSAVLLTSTTSYGSALVCNMPACEELKIQSANGINIVVQDWGHMKKNKPVLLFLHGTPFDHNVWMNQVHSNLSNSYRLITMDYRGHGNADPVTDPSQVLQQNWSQDVASVLNNPHYGISKAIIVAHSLGGVGAGDYLLQYGTDKVAGIIMVASPFDAQGLLTGATHTANPNIPCDLSQNSSNLCGEVDLFIASIEAATPAEFLTATQNLVLLKYVTPIPQGEVAFLVSQSLLSTQISKLNFLNGMVSEIAIDKTAAIGQLHLPVLFLFGDRNRTQYLQVYLNRYFPGGVPAIPGSTYKVYTNMDHIPMLQNKVEFNNDVANFAASVFGQ